MTDISTNPSSKTRNGPALKGRAAKKRVTWVIVIIILAIIAYWGWGKTHHNAASNLITNKVSRGDLIETISASGTVTAETGAEVHVGSQISGTIKKLNTDVGSKVKAGQLIAQLDLPDLQDQLKVAQASLAQAQTKYAQEVSGVNQVYTQTSTSINVAQQAVVSANQKLQVAIANANQQKSQTPSDILRAKTTLSSAQATLVQTQAGAKLQIATAQEAVVQAKANAANSAATLTREKALFAKGYVSQADLDAATAQNGVFQSDIRTATQNVTLTQQKVAADLQTASDAVTAQKAALNAANSETQTVLARNADVRDAQAAVSQANANLQAANANGSNNIQKQQDVQNAAEVVKQAQSQLAYEQAQFNKSFIRSPISGTVLQLAAQQGETVSAGLSTQTLLIVADLNKLQIDAYVDETDIGKVAIGQSAKCSVDAFPNQTFDGVITKIASGSTIQQGVVTYDVSISIEDPKHELKPDMTASVVIQTGVISNALLVPAVAVQIGTSGSTVNEVKVKNGKQTIVSVPVVTGGSDGVNIQILSGAKEGDTIVLAGALNSSGPSRAASSPFSAPPRGGSHG